MRRAVVAAALVATVAIGACDRPAPSPSASPVPPPAESAAATAAVVDERLLERLPDAIDGLPLTAETATAEELLADLPPEIAAIAVGLYIDPATDDLAIANVVALRPGVVSDAWFRTWRDEYDVSACEIAGGVLPGHAEATIGGRTTFIGTCAEGARTYHAIIDEDVVLSINAVGDGRLGERIVADLEE